MMLSASDTVYACSCLYMDVEIWVKPLNLYVVVRNIESFIDWHILQQLIAAVYPSLNAFTKHNDTFKSFICK